jgi:hypothetical protein
MLLDKNQQDMLIEALHGMLVADGVVNPSMSVALPMLIHIANEYIASKKPCKSVDNFMSDENNLKCDCSICGLEETAELELIRRSLELPDHIFMKKVRRDVLKMSEDDLQALLIGNGSNALGRIETGLVPTPKPLMQLMRLLSVKPELIDIIKEQQ